MRRAVSWEATLIDGPNHGTRAEGSAARAAVSMAERASPTRSAARPGQVPVGDRHPVRHAIEVGHGRVEVGYEGRRLDQGYAASVVEIARWLTWSLMHQPSAGVGSDQERSSRGRSRASSAPASAARSTATASMAGVVTVPASEAAASRRTTADLPGRPRSCRPLPDRLGQGEGLRPAHRIGHRVDHPLGRPHRQGALEAMPRARACTRACRSAAPTTSFTSPIW